MSVIRLSLSLTPETGAALRRLAESQATELSRLVENLLRENPLVAEEVRKMRSVPSTRKGRPLGKILDLAELVDASWRRREAAGEVRPIGG